MKNEDGSAMQMAPSPLLVKYAACQNEGVACLECDRCPRGINWRCTNVDQELYIEYLADLRRYHKVHNPKAYKESLAFRRD